MKTTLICFSPTGGSRAYGRAMAAAVEPDFACIDLTAPEGTGRERAFGPAELAVFSLPVYGGRLPAIALPRMDGLRGEGTPCILAVVYGNRHYDDALAELEDFVRARGFRPVGGAALVARHTYGEIQAGRPDTADLKGAAEFAGAAAQNRGLAQPLPGARPYRDGGGGGKFHPITSESCTRCGRCREVCPAGAVGEGFRTDPGRCISCFACIRACPAGAKNMDTPEYAEFARQFTARLAARRENEYFI